MVQPGRGGGHVRDVQHEVGLHSLGQVHPSLDNCNVNMPIMMNMLVCFLLVLVLEMSCNLFIID